MTETNMLPDFDLSQSSLHNSSLHNSSVIISATPRCLVQVIAPHNGTEPIYVSNPPKECCNDTRSPQKLFVSIDHFGLLLLPGFLLSISGFTHLPTIYSLCLAKAIYWYSICLLICIPLPTNYLNILYKVTSTQDCPSSNPDLHAFYRSGILF